MSPSPAAPDSFYRRHGKRWLDLALVLAALPPCVLGAAAVGLAILATVGRPILFRQTRAGLSGRPFTLLKFRTMTDAVDARGLARRDEQRITRLGRLLRRTSLDELPELWNVLRGDMSLVGPRPLLMEYLGLYTPDQARRHAVHPGITGWVQVHGRNTLSWPEKFRLDVWYVRHLSLWVDLWVLVLTPWAVCTGRGVSAAGFATMPPFEGDAGREDRPVV